MYRRPVTVECTFRHISYDWNAAIRRKREFGGTDVDVRVDRNDAGHVDFGVPARHEWQPLVVWTMDYGSVAQHLRIRHVGDTAVDRGRWRIPGEFACEIVGPVRENGSTGQ